MYKIAVEVIKQAVIKSQHKAIKNVNKELISLYFSLGKYISNNSRKGFWGSDALKIISDKLKAEMPGLVGFSSTSLKNMRTFYETWAELEDKSSIKIDDFQYIEYKPVLLTNKAWLQVPDLSPEAFFSIPFTHHIRIIEKVKTIEERSFYIKLSAQYQLTEKRLIKSMLNDDYHHQGELPNNFKKAIPDSLTAQRAIMAFKDEYLLDFINVEQIGARDLEDVDESIIENSIVHNIKNFIMTFGRDFSFIGNQYTVEAFGHTHKIDLLFYNRALAALVAVEIKKGNFKPSYLGQLSIYLQVLDDYVRKPYENPSIGIVLCGSAEKAYVEYAVRSYNNPLGVATYRSANDMPEEMRKALPSEEQLKELLER